MPRKRKAAPGEEAALQEQQRTEIVADAEHTIKHYGACIGCGARITPSTATLRCPTCAAWARWFSAHRVASAALREATQ